MAALLICAGTMVYGAVSSIGHASDRPVSVRVGVAWHGHSGTADRVFDGFQKRMKDIAPDVLLEVRRALADEGALRDAITAFEDGKTAMVILRSNSAEHILALNPTIPVLVGGISNPIDLGLTSDLNVPENGVTGVTHYVEHSVLLEVLVATVPDVSSILHVVQAGHPNANSDARGVLAACAAQNLDCEALAITSVEDAVAKVSEKAAAFDIVILGRQRLLVNQSKDITKAAGDTPVFAFSVPPVRAGALAGLSPDDRKLGAKLADSLIRVLSGETDLSKIPYYLEQRPQLYINRAELDAKGISIPRQLMDVAVIF